MQDPRLRAATSANAKLIFTQDYCYPLVTCGVYRPVTTLTYLFNYSILGSGTNPVSYHWVNLLLHWLDVVLVYLFVLRILRRKSLAFAAAALWGLHPTSTECVTNIIGRANLLAAAAVLGGMLCYWRATAASRWQKVPWLGALSVIFLIGLFSKESAIVLVGVMALYDLALWDEAHWRDRIAAYFVLAPPLLLFWYVRAHLYARLPLPEMPFVDNPMVGASFWAARLTAMKILGKYMWLIVYPRILSCDYSYNQIPIFSWRLERWEDWQTLLSLAICGSGAAIAILCYRRLKPVFFFILFFFVAIAPTSNVFLLIQTDMAERFLYLPAIGFIVCAVVAIDAAFSDIPERFPRWRFVAPAALLGMICLFFGERTYARNFDWTNDETLWSSAVAVVPESFKAHGSLAFNLFEQNATEERLDSEVTEAQRTLEILNNLPDEQNTAPSYAEAGTYFRAKGDMLRRKRGDGSAEPTEESLAWYQNSLKALLRGVRIDQAFNEHRRRIEMARGKSMSSIPNEGWPDLYRQLGITYRQLNDPQRSLSAWKYGLTLAPVDPAFYAGTALAYEAMGDKQQETVTLLAGLLINTNQREFRDRLYALYKAKDPHGCAIRQTNDGASIDIACPAVQPDLCAAYQALVQLFLQVKQENTAYRLKKIALSDRGCPAQPFNQALP